MNKNKTIYTVNLDKNRIALLIGAFLFLFGILLFIGIKFSNKLPFLQENNDVDDILTLDNISSNQVDKEDPIEVIPTYDFLNNQNHVKASDPKDLIIKEYDEPILKNLDPVNNNSDLLKDKKTNNTAKLFKKSTLDIANPGVEIVVKPKVTKFPKKQLSHNTKSTHYSIQVAAFLHEKYAIFLNKKLKKKKYLSRIDKGKRYYYVRVGGEKNKTDLKVTFNKLRQELKSNIFIIKTTI